MVTWGGLCLFYQLFFLPRAPKKFFRMNWASHFGPIFSRCLETSMLMLNHRLQRAFSISWLAGAGQSRGAGDGAAVAWQHGLLPIVTGTCWYILQEQLQDPIEKMRKINTYKLWIFMNSYDKSIEDHWSPNFLCFIPFQRITHPDFRAVSPRQAAVERDLGCATTSVSRLDRPTSGALPVVLGQRMAQSTMWCLGMENHQWKDRNIVISYGNIMGNDVTWWFFLE